MVSVIINPRALRFIHVEKCWEEMQNAINTSDLDEVQKWLDRARALTRQAQEYDGDTVTPTLVKASHVKTDRCCTEKESMIFHQ